MKRNPFNILAVVALLLSAASFGYVALAQDKKAATAAPTVVSYQGYVTVNGVPYTGTGYFKFAIVDGAGTTSYWSNDGTSSGGGAPTAYVTLTVTNGLFNVLLGDTTLSGMTQPLTGAVFSGPDRALRVWFASSSGGPFTHLTPDRKFASVPFALVAETAASAAYAENAGLLGGNPPAWYQQRLGSACPPGFAVLEVLADGTLTCKTVEDRPVFSRTSLDSSGDVGSLSTLVIGVDGLGLITYYDYSNSKLKIAHCNNTACSTAAVNTLDTVYSGDPYSSLAIGADGLGLVVYQDFSASRMKVAHCNNLACTAPTITALDGMGDSNRDFSIAIGADGLALISYNNDSGGLLRVAHCNNTACTSASVANIDSGASLGLYTSLAIGADGLGLISYRAGGNLHAAHCKDISCSAAELATLDSTLGVGKYTSLAIGADGLGVISYYDETNTALMAAHCSDTACTSATLTALDSDGTMGLYTSLTIGADGLPVISYWDDTNKDYKVAHCTDVLCSAAALTVLDDLAPVASGNSTSITIGTDGLPLVSYYAAGALKVAHCSNTLCIPYTRAW